MQDVARGLGHGLSDLGHVMACQGADRIREMMGSAWTQSPPAASAGPGPGGRGGRWWGGTRKTVVRTDSCFVETRELCESWEPERGTEVRGSDRGVCGMMDGANFDESGRCLETVLCLVLPGSHAGGPERVRARLKVTQQLVLAADLLARGLGPAPLWEGGM